MRRPDRGAAVLVLSLAVACAPSPDAEVPAAEQPGAADLKRTPPILQPFDIGGDFVLTAQDGTRFDLAEHRGDVFLMFFGYTHCPDFCPATLSLLGQVDELLGEDGGAATTLLVTIDPDRDTPEVLAKYVGYFGVPALGLSGSMEEIEAVLAAYAGFVETEENEAGELVFGHTTQIYLIDHQGKVRYTFRPNDEPEFIAAGVRQQIEIARGQSRSDP